MIPKFRRGQEGLTLIEIVASLALLALIGVGLLNGLWGISKNEGIYDERSTALILVRSQIEEIKAAAYDASGNYTPTVNYPGYTFSISGVETEAGKQIVTIAVNHGTRGVLSVPFTKADWQ